MRWNWEELTAPEFARAVADASGVCVLPVGVIEKHGEHLPLGTDLSAVRAVAERATAQEPALIFPSYYFGQIHEAKHVPGTIALTHELMFALLDNICAEIARNGCKKIILLDGHGGNRALLPAFVMSRLERPRDYTVYLVGLGGYMPAGLNDPQWQAMQESELDEHAGEGETSVQLALNPELVRMDAVAPGTRPLGRLAHLPHVFTATFWYADYPDHYAGDAHPATAEKGEFLLQRYAARVAEIIAAVKADTVAPALEREFYSRNQHDFTER